VCHAVTQLSVSRARTSPLLSIFEGRVLVLSGTVAGY
jgi:hypothetical protein